MRLQDKVIIVTGSTTGIGEAIALRCLREGAKVLIHGRDRARAESIAKSHAGRAVVHLNSLEDPDAPRQIVEATVRAFGRIDGVVNNAALVLRSNIYDTSAAVFDRILAVNVRAPLLLIQARPALLEGIAGSGAQHRFAECLFGGRKPAGI